MSERARCDMRILDLTPFEAVGCHAEFCERPEEIGPALDRAFASGRPALVNVLTDPMARAETAKFSAWLAM